MRLNDKRINPSLTSSSQRPKFLTPTESQGQKGGAKQSEKWTKSSEKKTDRPKHIRRKKTRRLRKRSKEKRKAY